jgi:hypothetical protein
MDTVGEIAKHVSGQLSDQQQGKEYTRWHRDTLIEYMREGLREIGTYRPEAFAFTSTVPLVEGTRQALADGAVLEEITANTDGTPPHKSDDKLLKAFGAYAACAPNPRFVKGQVKYAVKSYAVDSANPTIFYVNPPVPAGISVSVLATTNSKAPEYDLADWNTRVAMQAKFYNNLIDFMMARAYQRDTESQVSQGQATRLLQLFYQSMGTKYKIDSARQSGYYLGEVGTGDPRSAVR